MRHTRQSQIPEILCTFKDPKKRYFCYKGIGGGGGGGIMCCLYTISPINWITCGEKDERGKKTHVKCKFT